MALRVAEELIRDATMHSVDFGLTYGYSAEARALAGLHRFDESHEALGSSLVGSAGRVRIRWRAKRLRRDGTTTPYKNIALRTHAPLSHQSFKGAPRAARRGDCLARTCAWRASVEEGSVRSSQMKRLE